MKKEYLIGLGLFVFLIIVDFTLFYETRWFWSIVILSIGFGILPTFVNFLREGRRQKEVEIQFLEFVRSLAEGVKSGAPIPQSILNLKDKDFGALTPYIQKLIHQIEWGVPIKDALAIFSKDSNNRVINRSVAIIIQAEESGGKMDDILESVVESVLSIERLKDERRSGAYSQMVQGYIVFFIFISVMLLLEVKLLPMVQNMVEGMSSGVSGGFFDTGEVAKTAVQINFKKIFLSLIVVQGFFAGLMIGKFSEGSLKYGLKHSAALIMIALLIILTVSPP